jgi:two-component system, OmpR family, sensor histidine kinase TctE
MITSEFSLRRALIKRISLALAVIGVVGGSAAYLLGYRYANLAYDRALFDGVETLAEQVSWRDGRLQVNLPPAAQKWLLANEGERVVWQIIDLQTSQTIDGNGSLGRWIDDGDAPGGSHYRDTTVGDVMFRVAYLRTLVGPDDRPVLVEIGETLGRRVLMARKILAGTLLLMATMIMVAAVLIWRGVHTALLPLRELQAEAARRSSSNLTPLELGRAPQEVRGLIHSINNMMQRLTESIESQRRFTANAAHQLRTPIAGLRLQAQIALKNSAAQPIRNHLEEIDNEAGRAAHLIDQLLTLSKAESDELAITRAPVDLTQVALRTIERHLPQAIAMGVDMGYEGVHAGAVVEGNEILLTELMSNLVDNALRYGRRNGKVTLSASIDVDAVVVSVTDDGPGFPETNRDRLFQRLHRSDSATPGSGSGLGLAIVKEIADRYHAAIDMESVPDHGCCFRLRFPRRPIAGSAVLINDNKIAVPASRSIDTRNLETDS